MDKYHPRRTTTPLLIVIIAFLSSCCIHKNATTVSNDNFSLTKEDNDSLLSNTDSLLKSIHNLDSLYLYTIVSPQQQDSMVKDSIAHYKIGNCYGKISPTNAAIFDFIIKESIFRSTYPPIKQPFYPYCALNCFKGNKQYTILFSLGSEEFRVLSKENKEETYQILQMRTILHWLNIILPNDEYIKSLLKWKQLRNL